MIPNKRKLSLVIIAFGIVVIVIFSLLSANYIDGVSNVLADETTKSMLQSTRQGEMHINHSIATDLLGLDILATTITTEENNDKQQIIDWIKLFTKEDGYFDIAICGLDGFGVTSNGREVNLYKKAQFKSATQGSPTVSHYFDTTLKEPMISFDVPIIKEGKVAGVISAIKETEYLSSALNISTIVDYSNAYIINSEGMFIAIADNSSISRNMQSVNEFINNPNNTIEEINEFSDGLATNSTYIGTLHSRGEPKLFAYTPIQGVSGWFYMTVIPESIVHKQTTQITSDSLKLLITFIIILTLVFFIILSLKNKHTKQLAELAHVDQLTKIPNWNKFKFDCEKLLLKSPKQARAIVSIDIDDFKVVNDIYGHQEGNKVLIKLASILEKNVMLGERYSRYSSDTFLAMLNYSSDDSLIEWIKNFKDQVYANCSKYSLTLSFGIYKFNESKHSIDIMCDRANLARRTIKGDHEQLYAFYQDETRRQIIQVKEIENDMHSALDNHQFVVYFQPKHSFTDESLVGAEALTRWVHPIKGMIFPDSFIKVFERNGFIIHLDMYVLAETCKIIRKWLDAGITPITVSVNMSQIHLKDSGFVQSLIQTAAQYNVPPKYIEIELTESAIFENLDAFTKVVHELKQHGFTVSMDDFGSGYSSLNLLSELQVDILKIDRIFLTKSSDSERGKCIIESVIGMAKKLGILAVSEGVETKEQVSFLKDAGCDIAQGYFYSRPLSLEAFEEYLNAQSIDKTDIN